MKKKANNLDELTTEFKQHLTKLRLTEIQRHTEEKKSMVSKQIKKLLGDNGE